jgi:hypothetical protein
MIVKLQSKRVRNILSFARSEIEPLTIQPGSYITRNFLDIQFDETLLNSLNDLYFRQTTTAAYPAAKDIATDAVGSSVIH